MREDETISIYSVLKNLDNKMEKIKEQVSETKTMVAIINDRDDRSEKWKHSQEGKLTAIEQVMDAYNQEVTIVKARNIIIGKITNWLLVFASTVSGGIIVGVVVYFINHR